jgi:hypothetical protein
LAQYNELPVYKATYDLLLAIFQFTKDFNREYTRHYRTYKIRRGMILEIMDKQWWKHAYFFGGFLKARLKRNSVSKYESI